MNHSNESFLENSVILDSIIGWESKIGNWSRVEGTLPKINPDQASGHLL